jgi:hypothetical protein
VRAESLLPALRQLVPKVDNEGIESNVLDLSGIVYCLAVADQKEGQPFGHGARQWARVRRLHCMSGRQ